MLVVFGGLICPIYLYIFNKKTRQSLHDLICQTYVVKADVISPISIGSLSRVHYVIVGIVFIGILAIMFALHPGPGEDQVYLDVLYEAVSDIDNSIPAGVSIGTAYGPKGSNRYVAARVIYQIDPGDLEIASEQIAKVILSTKPPISHHEDIISITALYGFDIGISSSWQVYVKGLTPVEWEEKIASRQNYVE